MTKHYFFPKI